jgi:adenylate cyclase
LAKNEPGRLSASSDTVNAASDDEQTRWSLGETVTLRGHDQPTQLAAPV